MTENEPFRILALPGGGVRGIFQALFLRRAIEEDNTVTKRTRRPHECFDLVSGTSTGALLALAIALDVDLGRVADLYQKNAAKVFSGHGNDLGWILGSLWRGRAEPRNTAGLATLRMLLETLFGTAQLRDCKRRVLIPATDLYSFKAKVFDSEDVADQGRTATDVALASAAAPSYFPAVRLQGVHDTYVDGGLWANSPLLVAVSKTQARDNRKALIVGNGQHPQGLTADDYNTLPALDLLATTLELMFGSQQAAIEEQATAFLGSPNVVNVNVPLSSPITLDDAARANSFLPGTVATALEDHRAALRAFFS